MDALLLAELAIGYLPTTRAFAGEYAGITHVRWENAQALLRLATVHNGDDVVIEDFDQAVALLAGTVENMEKAGSVERLKLRVPVSLLWRRR